MRLHLSKRGGPSIKSPSIALTALLAVGLALGGCQNVTKPATLDRTAGAGAKTKYSSAEKAVPKKKRAVVTFNVSVESFRGARKIRLWLPQPVSNEHQTITDVKVSGNFASRSVNRERQFGNTMIYAEWNNPTAKPHVSFSFKVDRKETLRKDFADAADSAIPADAQAFLVSSRNVPLGGKVKETAENVTTGKTTAAAKTEAVYDYLVENFQRDDTIKGCGKGDACQVLSTKKGKCADVHSVFVGMARSVGVPAREIFGIRVKGDNNDMTKSFHCRAEFYASGYGWVPVDASDVLKLMLKENLALRDPKVKEARSYFFGAQTETYVDFGTGRDLTLNPPQDGGKLNYFMYPYAEVDGRPLDYLAQKDLTYKVTFKDL